MNIFSINSFSILECSKLKKINMFFWHFFQITNISFQLPFFIKFAYSTIIIIRKDDIKKKSGLNCNKLMQILFFSLLPFNKFEITLLQLNYFLPINILSQMTIDFSLHPPFYNIIHHLHVWMIMKLHSLALRQMIQSQTKRILH